MKYAIEAHNLNKKYKILKEKPHDTFRDYIYSLPRSLSLWNKKEAYREFWALRNISFQVERGSVLGIIGKNGAGKSTLLKILSRIVSPSTGTAIIRGKVSSILEVGTGFHPELTGRENVYLNGAILGMKRREIDKKFDEIVEFSEISKFLDVPVKRYSSGMQVRLAFSVATTLDSDVLLIDEVLAVGDVSFRRKSLEKMQNITKNQGRTVIFVSHNMMAIDYLCDKVMYLENGKVNSIGDTGEIVSKYVRQSIKIKQGRRLNLTNRRGTGKVKVQNFWIEDEHHNRLDNPVTGKDCYFVIQFIKRDSKKSENVDIGFDVKTLLGHNLIVNYLSYLGQEINKCPPKGLVRFKIRKLPLAAGEYTLGFRVTVNNIETDCLPNAYRLTVEEGDFYKIGIPITQRHSPIYLDGFWEHDFKK